MKILAFDTSTEFCSVALYLDGKVTDIGVHAGRSHSERLLPMIHDILNDSGLELTQLDGIAFGAGPGSFTGLRIACGVAQGLAFAADLPVIGIRTLEAIAEQSAQDKVIVATDARMGEIYHAAFIRQGKNWRVVSEPVLCQPQNAPEIDGSHWTGCGSGFDLYHQILSQRYASQLSTIRHDCYPHAREIAQLAAAKDTRDFYSDPALAAPIYIRNKVALKESER